MGETKKEIKKITLTDVIKNKEKYQVRDDVTQDLIIDRLDGIITIQKPERSLCLETIQMAHDPNQADKSNVFVVYNSIVEPNLKDKDLQKEFGCVEPQDIVEKIFEPGEVDEIAKACFALAGYGNSISKVKDLKN
ncbi:phage tail assembly chaperone [Bacillus sp. JJ722]|uniref:phage tail assembly chaperone n=1 Tax=Bacillus sp. JJ722 TaxID=3122973 RepID=UPI003000306C